MPPVKRNMETMKKKMNVSKYHYNWSSRSPEIVVIELHREHTDCHDCILSSVCDQKIKKSQNYKPLSRRTRTLYVNCWPYVTALRRFNLSQERRGTRLLDPCNSSLIAPKGEKGVNQATSRLSDCDIPSSPDNYESISSMFRRSVLLGFFLLFDNTRKVLVRCRSQLFSETRVLYS